VQPVERCVVRMMAATRIENTTSSRLLAADRNRTPPGYRPIQQRTELHAAACCAKVVHHLERLWSISLLPRDSSASESWQLAPTAVAMSAMHEISGSATNRSTSSTLTSGRSKMTRETNRGRGSGRIATTPLRDEDSGSRTAWGNVALRLCPNRRKLGDDVVEPPRLIGKTGGRATHER